MTFKLITLLLLCTLQSFSAEGELELDLPSVPVLSLNAQEALFVTAYEEVGPATLNPVTTPVPGLAPMIAVHYSYVRGLVEKSSEHVDLLKQFWKKTQRVIERNELTVGMMKSIATQLAFLLTDMVGGEKSSRYPLWEDYKWQDLDNYDPVVLFYQYRKGWNFKGDEFSEWPPKSFTADNIDPCGFDCEAILCCKGGGFSFERFVKNYLERDFVLHISALPFIKEGADKGPHGGIHDKNPLSFLTHEFDHVGFDFNTGKVTTKFTFEHREVDRPLQEKGLTYWEAYRGLLRRVVANSKNLKRDHAAIFLLLHEGQGTLGLKLHSPASVFDEKEELIFSERLLFLSLEFLWERHPVENFLRLSLRNPYPAMKVAMTLEGYTEKRDRLYRMQVALKAKDSSSTSLGKGSLEFDLEYRSVGDGVSTEIIVSKGIFDWGNLDDFLTADDKRDIEGAPIVGCRLGSSSIVEEDPLEGEYRLNYADYIGLFQDLYGPDVLPPKEKSLLAHVEAVWVQRERFWKEFYDENRHLFSTELLAVGSLLNSGVERENPPKEGKIAP
ncbi:hypothetical protein OAN21_01280 [Alphaproteobacteria bacterium]|nr:hypothetical protein [Alphaproteobacteria bacterium]